MPNSNPVFYSIAAQPDNLGDVVIRKILLDWLDDSKRPMFILVSTMPESYVRAFSVPGSATLIRNPFHYQLRLIRALLVGRPSIVFAPGPQIIGYSGRARAKSVVNAINSILVKLRRGQVLIVGRSYSGNKVIARSVERITARLADLCVVRDTGSLDTLALKRFVAPDLAYFKPSSGIGSSQDRPQVAVSLRGDKPASSGTLEWIKLFAASRGLSIILVTQVARDDAQHHNVASELGCDVVEWQSNDYVAQLKRVENAYAHSAFVITDRLHAAILGARNGAIPICIVHPGVDKLPKTLSVVGEPKLMEPEIVTPIFIDKDNFSVERGKVVADVEAASARLEDIRAMVLTTLSDTGGQNQIERGSD
ncbi:polysaccharide pyruvyl transferase family protein [Paramicrobacterium fandaimingii]|uniref:polysaccharide pyruvyl transferase family protein n=1 Tax=Paramicrobacterium fandaimingii TaxID=2708079 RepID=UPI0014227E08|nr:polysaccharide pyruvyl transferase family protein [Microbacterium fandaimingii]